MPELLTDDAGVRGAASRTRSWCPYPPAIEPLSYWDTVSTSAALAIPPQSPSPWYTADNHQQKLLAVISTLIQPLKLINH